MAATTLRRELLERAAPGIALLLLGGLVWTGLASRAVAERDARLRASQLDRASDSFEASERALRALVMDYALWDDMVAFVGDPDPTWAHENLSPWLKDQHGIDFLLVVGLPGRAVYVSDPTGSWSTGDEVPEMALVHARRHPTRPFLLQTPGGSVWVAGAPIQPTLSSRFSPPGAGTLLAGIVLTPSFVGSLGASTGLATRLGPASESPAAQADGGTPWRTLADAGGRPVAALVAEREAVAAGPVWSRHWALAAYFLTSLLAGLLLLALAAEKAVVGPLLSLRRGVDELRRSGRISRELPADRRDEIGELASGVASLASELRDSEFSRQRSEGQLHALLDATPDDIMLLDGEGQALGLKRSTGGTSLIPVGAGAGDSIEALCGPELAAEVRERIRETLATGEMRVFERDATDDEGQPRTWEGRIVPTGGGEVVAIWRDTTERRQAEEARERLSAIVDATPDLVLTAHLDGRLRYVNPASRRVLGLGLEQSLEPLRLSDFVVTQHRALLADEALPAAARDGAWSGELAMLGRGSDREIPVSVVLLAHRDARGSASFLSAIARDISDRKRFEARLLHLADHDPLTDLLGRRRFGEELEREVAQSRRYGHEGALAFIDLDDFKFINDTLGHNAGDELLIGIGRLLQSRLRRTDSLARLGGDEFAVLLPRAGRRHAEQVVGGLLETMRREPHAVGGRPVSVTASAGVVLFPEHGTDPAELLARADLAMYQAKSRGRNAHCLFESDQDWEARAESKLHGEQRIRDALESDRLLLYAQPVMDLRSGRIEQFELLLRMRDEAGRLVRPGAFLGVAERFGLIHAIDRWVVSEAIRLLADERSAGRLVRASVNVSGRAFEDRELPGLIRGELLSHGMTASALALEVTESAAIADTGLAESFAAALAELGCRLSLDDFGVGFSSLYHLKNLPVDILKIDGSFVRDMARNPVDVHLVRAIVEVGRALRKETVAEFVADAATLALVRECGVDHAQGYHIGRPGPAAQVFELFGHDGPAPDSGDPAVD